jgi:hypothetical protein
MRDDDDKPDGDYQVGYGRPPKHTRFKPGQSGNPGGRKRKSKDLQKLIQSELDTLITVQDAGREKHITKREALVKQLVNLAIKGNPKPLQLVLTYLEKHREVEPFTPTEADDAALLAACFGPNYKEDNHGDR